VGLQLLNLEQALQVVAVELQPVEQEHLLHLA
jgi:hypothetical protein